MSEQRDAEAKRVGHLIAQLRQSKGWTQEDLAHEVGVRVSTVSRWERGLSIGYGANVRKLATALDVSPPLLRPREPEIQTQLDRIEAEINRQGQLLDALAEVVEQQLGARAAAAARRSQQRDLDSSRAAGRRARA